MPGPIDCTGYLEFKGYSYDNIVSNIINGYKYTSESAEERKKAEVRKAYTPVRIIYNDPATIVFWKDGTKTVVKRSKGEKYNEYTAFCAALAKKIFGNNSITNSIVASGYHQKEKKTTKK